MVLFGQGGVLYSGLDGLSIVVPDKKGGFRNVPLDQLRMENQAPEPPTPTEMAGTAPEVQYLPAPEPVICQCVCPPCPALTEPSPMPSESPSPDGERRE